jgi:hypothetical protein
MKPYMPFVLVVLLSLHTLQVSCANQHADDHNLLEMHIKGVTIAPDSDAPIVVLEDVQGHQAFPIWVGLLEARAIALEMEGLETPRPLTHALLKNILTTLQVQVRQIVINDMQHNTFYAAIVLQQGDKTLRIDARPSDAIALALQAQAPIFVSQKVLSAIRTVTLAPPDVPQATLSTLGMHIQSLDTQLSQAFHLPSTAGVLVAFVEPGGQAERHGVRQGDVITRVDDHAVKDPEDFVAFCQAKPIDQSVVLHVTRDQSPLQLRLQLASPRP